MYICLIIFVVQSTDQKISDAGGIRTQIIGVEGMDADHYTTTTACYLHLFASLEPTTEFDFSSVYLQSTPLDKSFIKKT